MVSYLGALSCKRCGCSSVWCDMSRLLQGTCFVKESVFSCAGKTHTNDSSSYRDKFNSDLCP